MGTWGVGPGVGPGDLGPGLWGLGTCDWDLPRKGEDTDMISQYYHPDTNPRSSVQDYHIRMYVV